MSIWCIMKITIIGIYGTETIGDRAILTGIISMLGKVFNKYPRMIRDLANELKKKVNFIISGEDTEVDKSILEQIADPLMHIIRNSIDHGLEYPEERIKFGKPHQGTISLSAYYEVITSS